MNFWTAVVIIVAIWAFIAFMRSRNDPHSGHASHEDGEPRGTPHREAELQREVEQLRERLEVLERIATDANSNEALERKRLSAEIEQLREDEGKD